MRVYEGMFLMDPILGANYPDAEAEINRILDRAEAKLLGIKKWDERRLAYPIGRQKRGLYVLSFFEAAAENIPGMERDVQLSETALRVLILRKENMTQEDIEKALAADPPPKAPARGEDWRGPRTTGDRDNRGDRGDRGNRGDRDSRGDRGDRGAPGESKPEDSPAEEKVSAEKASAEKTDETAAPQTEQPVVDDKPATPGE